jgi:hypothetical protein
MLLKFQFDLCRGHSSGVSSSNVREFHSVGRRQQKFQTAPRTYFSKGKLVG